LQNEISEFSGNLTSGQVKKWNTFKNNLIEGVKYYRNLFNEVDFFANNYEENQSQLDESELKILNIVIPAIVK